MQKDTDTTSAPPGTDEPKRRKRRRISEDTEDVFRVIEATKDSDFENWIIIPMRVFTPEFLSRKKVELINRVRKGDIESETHLARELGRSRPNVVADLKLLEYHGLIKRERRGRRIVPVAQRTPIVII